MSSILTANDISSLGLEYRPGKSGKLHSSLYAFACEAAEEGLTEEEARAVIEAGLRKHQTHRDPDDREIRAAIRDGFLRIRGGTAYRRAERPSYDPDSAGRAHEKWELTTDDLLAASPAPPPSDPKAAISCLFGRDELVCMGTSVKTCRTRPLSKWLAVSDLRRQQFIVPNPMSGRTGSTQSGIRGRPRTRANTRPRRWVVAEFDEPPLELQPSIIRELVDKSGEWPAVVVHSGNRSLQAWFRIGSASDEAVAAFEEIAIRLGADPAVLGEARKHQMVRTPAAMRDNGKQQTILYWNPQESATESHENNLAEETR